MEPVDLFLSKLTNIFGTHEKISSILMPCIQHLIIRPRFHLISILTILGDKLLAEDYDNDKIKEFIIDSKQWILSKKNKEFTKLYYRQNNGETNVTIPLQIKKDFKKLFGENIDKLLNKYIEVGDNVIIKDLMHISKIGETLLI
jgi:hypothetical protein